MFSVSLTASSRGRPDEASAASWKEILDVNLMSYVFCAKAAVPLMRRNKGGAIVNVASVRSVVAGGGNLQYDTTKARFHSYCVGFHFASGPVGSRPCCRS